MERARIARLGANTAGSPLRGGLACFIVRFVKGSAGGRFVVLSCTGFSDWRREFRFEETIRRLIQVGHRRGSDGGRSQLLNRPRHPILQFKGTWVLPV